MTSIILLLVLVAVVFIIRILFNQERRNSAQEKIDAVKQERIFWRLVNGYEGLMLGIDAIVTVHLDSRLFGTYLVSSSDAGKRTAADERILKHLVKKSITKSAKSLNVPFKKAEKTIGEMLMIDTATFTKADIQRIFEDRKENRMLSSCEYDRFVELYLRLLPSRESLENKFTKTEIWEARKMLKEATSQFEWKTDEIKEDAATVFVVRKSEVEIGNVLGDLLCDKDSESSALREALTDWENIQMLNYSCLIDLMVPWDGTNLIQRLAWKAIAEIAG